MWPVVYAGLTADLSRAYLIADETKSLEAMFK